MGGPTGIAAVAVPRQRRLPCRRRGTGVDANRRACANCVVRRRIALTLLCLFGLHLTVPALAAAAFTPAMRVTSIGAGDAGGPAADWLPRAASADELGRLNAASASRPDTGPCACQRLVLSDDRHALVPVATGPQPPAHRPGHRPASDRGQPGSEDPS